MLQSICAIYDLSAEELRHSLLPRHVGARRALVYVLRCRGRSYGEIARVLGMKSKSAVRRLYLQAELNPDYRISHLL